MTKFGELRLGLDPSLTNTQGNLAPSDGGIPRTNLGLGTICLAAAVTEHFANRGTATLLVDEVEHGLESHQFAYVLRPAG